LGFVLGSAAAITFALAGTAVVFMILRSEYPRLAGELGPLLLNVGVFVVLTAAAAASFYGEIKLRDWRRAAEVALILMLGVVAAYQAWTRY
jgi:hypothetical protein